MSRKIIGLKLESIYLDLERDIFIYSKPLYLVIIIEKVRATDN